MRFLDFAPLRALSLMVGLSALLYFVAYSNLEMIRYEAGRYEMSDFTYHLQLLSYFWFNELGDLYSPEYQNRALSALRGSTSGAMPVGLSPTFIVILLPFAAIAQLDFKLAQALWMGLSLFLLLAGLKSFLRHAGLRATRLSVFIPLLLTVLTVPMLRCIALGQTSIFAAGALMLLSTRDNSASRNWIKSSLLLFGLSLKTPYLMIGTLIVLSSRDYRPLIATGFLILLSAGLLTSLSGNDWIDSFITTQRSYQEGVFSQMYAQTTSQPDSTVFANSFSDIIEPSVGRRISLWIFALTACLSLLLVILDRQRGLACYLALCAYLLFSPYAGIYENVITLSALPFLLVGQSGFIPFYGSLLFLLLCGGGSTGYVWLFQFAILASMGAICSRGQPVIYSQ